MASIAALHKKLFSAFDIRSFVMVASGWKTLCPECHYLKNNRWAVAAPNRLSLLDAILARAVASANPP
jgi:hypothetical protein